MFQDIMKDSWVYQEIVQESEERGREEGREQGREEGAQKALREAIMQCVAQRFPTLEILASQRIAHMTDVNSLNVLLVTLFTAQEVEVARQLLVDAAKN